MTTTLCPKMIYLSKGKLIRKNGQGQVKVGVHLRLGHGAMFADEFDSDTPTPLSRLTELPIADIGIFGFPSS